MKSTIRFDLSKNKTGEFDADVELNQMEKEIINPVAETLGGVQLKNGILQGIKGHVEGNNFRINGNISATYRDLNIVALKKETGQNGKIKKKKVTSFIANTFLIKNSNPSPGEDTRRPEFSIERDHHSHFFNFVWQAFLSGILKTIGIPVKLVVK